MIWVTVASKSTGNYSNYQIMDIKDFSALLKAKRKELDMLMRRELPVKVGRMAKDHYQDNFRKGGFVNGGLRRWPVTKTPAVRLQVCGGRLRPAALTTQPSVLIRQIYAGRLPRQGGQRRGIRPAA